MESVGSPEMSVRNHHSVLCYISEEQRSHDDLAVQPMVWLCMVWFRVIWFDVVWFSISYVNLK
jgi:hypothetical protein